MRWIAPLRRMAVLALLIAATGTLLAQEKIDPKKLLGKWEPVDAKIANLTLEFMDKGKWTLSVDVMGRLEKIEGTYKITDNKMEVTIGYMGTEQKEMLTIKKLNDTEFVTVDSKGKEEAFRRKK